MKPSVITVFGKTIPGALLVLFTAGSVSAQSPAPSQDSVSGTDSAAAKGLVTALAAARGASIKYLGSEDEMLLFNVSYTNPQGSKFIVSVKDQDGTVLYQNQFKEKTFYKQFRLPKSDRDRIVFILHNGRDADVVKTFEVNVNSRFVQEVAVKKL